MTLLAKLLMVLSVTFVTGLTIWCYWKVLAAPDEPK